MKKMLALAVVVTAVAFAGASTAKADHNQCRTSGFGGSGFRSYYPSRSYSSYYPSSSFRSRSSYYPSRSYPSRSYYRPSYGHQHHHHDHGYRRSSGLYIRSGSFVFGIR